MLKRSRTTGISALIMIPQLLLFMQIANSAINSVDFVRIPNDVTALQSSVEKSGTKPLSIRGTCRSTQWYFYQLSKNAHVG
jgi:hypothetical protein